MIKRRSFLLGTLAAPFVITPAKSRLLVNQLTGFNAGGAPGVQTLIPQGEGTAIGNMTSGGGLAAAFDGDNDQASGSCATSGVVTEFYIGKDWGAGNERAISGVKIWGSNNNGYTSFVGTVDIDVRGDTSDSGPTGGTKLGDIFNDTDVNNANPQELLSGLPVTTFRYHWVVGTVAVADANYFAEVEFYENV